LEKKRKARANAHKDPKGKRKMEIVDLIDIDEELEQAGEQSGSGKEDAMDMGQ
jgi:hypothetical protein